MELLVAIVIRIVTAIVSVGGWSAVAGGLWVVANDLEQNGTPRARQTAKRLLRPEVIDRRMVIWVIAFRDMINTVFTEKHWSWRCFRRSVYASALVITALFALLIVAKPQMRELFSLASQFELWIQVSSIATTVLGDFIALWIARIFIGQVGVNSHSKKVVALFLLTICAHVFLVSTLVICRWWLMNIAIVTFTSEGEFARPDRFVGWLFNFLTFSEDTPEMKDPRWLSEFPMVWSPFFTVFWLLLYALAAMLAGIGHRLASIMRFYRGAYDVNKRPFHALARAMIAIWTVVYVAVLAPMAWGLSTAGVETISD